MLARATLSEDPAKVLEAKGEKEEISQVMS
jgi:hypothetical protein